MAIHVSSYGSTAKQTDLPSCLLSTSELKAKLHFLVQFEHAKEFNAESVEESEGLIVLPGCLWETQRRGAARIPIGV